MDLKNVKNAFDNITKKQKLCSSKLYVAVERIAQEIDQALMELQSTDASTSDQDHKVLVDDLKTKLKEISLVTQLEASQKELNVALNKYPKQLEKTFIPDISKAYRNVDFDTNIVNHIITSCLYREGLYELGNLFANESGEQDAIAMKAQFVEMHRILLALKSHNLEPSFMWATSNQDKLRQSRSDLELQLHRLQFVEILQNGDRKDAMAYAKAHLSQLYSSYLVEIQKLISCLLWAGRLESSPYADLLSPVNYEKLAQEFTRQFTNLLGESFENPLSVTVEAGIRGLPTLLKLMNVMAGKIQEWQSMEQLPIPIDLGTEFQFHTVFVCPVSRDQSSEENPPMMMPCGHVLCNQSIMKLSKNSTKNFKCPYCPHKIDASRCKQLFF